MLTVAQALQTKPQKELATQPPEASVRDALQLMAERDIGSILILQDGALKGIFTERDYARKITLKGLNSTSVKLADVMTSRLYAVKPEDSVQACMGIMSQARIRHLPVMQGETVIGLVSIGDLVNSLLAEQRYLIEQLESYIAGGLS